MRFYTAAVALLMAYAAMPAAQASMLPSNLFQNVESPTSDHAHRKASSGRDVGSPFGFGCVGTDPICAMSLSSADKTERATLRRDVPPELWQVKEDMAYEKTLRAALPGERLEKFMSRLGGEETWSQKLSWSQKELLRRQIEDEARSRAEKKANDKLRQLEHDEEEQERLRSMTWRQRLFASPVYEEHHQPTLSLRADRDQPSARMVRKVTRKEIAEKLDWHKGLRDRFTHPLDYDAEDFSDRFNPEMLAYGHVKLSTPLRRRNLPRRLDDAK